MGGGLKLMGFGDRLPSIKRFKLVLFTKNHSICNHMMDGQTISKNP